MGVEALGYRFDCDPIDCERLVEEVSESQVVLSFRNISLYFGRGKCMGCVDQYWCYCSRTGGTILEWMI